MNDNTEINSEEILLMGSWKMSDGKVVADEVCSRIETLKSSYLKKIAVDKSGWETLYQDPNDNRYWLLIYPNSENQGGGAPTLKNITRTEAYEKFEIN